MPKNYQAVQAGHAVAQYMLDYPGTWQNNTLVYLKVKDEDDIGTWNQRFAEWGFKQSPFQEPDMDHQVTALAVLSEPDVDNMLSFMKLV